MWRFWRRISPEQQSVLRALAEGATLKAHRTMDGAKEHRVHTLHGKTFVVSESTINALKRRRLIDSNMKFPAATYLLTDKGKRAIRQLAHTDASPLSAQKYHRK